MNRTTLIGRMTRAPKLVSSVSGTSVINFTLAVDRSFKNRDGERECDFLQCVAFGKPAELIGVYMQKGELLAVSGRLQSRTYEKEGEKRYVTEVVVDEVTFLGKKTELTAEPTEIDFSQVSDGDDLPF